MHTETTSRLEEGQDLSKGQLGVIAIHALIGWALCAATMGIGMAVTSIQTALIVHAIGAPIFLRMYHLTTSENSVTRPHLKQR